MKTYFLRMTGRCSNGSERDGGSLFHAVRAQVFPGWMPAICGAQPGFKGNGWSEHEGTEATCPRCLKRLNK